MIPAMVLAAGIGSRLRPLTDRRAKSMVPVGDRPALAHLIDRLHFAQVSTIVVNAHHRAEDLRAFAPGHGIILSEEEEILGTAGGVARASALLGQSDALVWNADIVAEIDVRALTVAHARTAPHATLVVQPRR
ncbi:MAG: sugar phosphate nucleotidyltransferase, partial [Myxococcota bacterium]|nr:sugar phosphate nucleotidyltransferase [Myxococcota bacterium]